MDKFQGRGWAQPPRSPCSSCPRRWPRGSSPLESLQDPKPVASRYYQPERKCTQLFGLVRLLLADLREGITWRGPAQQ